jgi:TPR repeat protein
MRRKQLVGGQLLQRRGMHRRSSISVWRATTTRSDFVDQLLDCMVFGCMIGVCYHTGQGVIKDTATAALWWSAAAAQGHAQAQFNLGMASHHHSL